MDIPGVSIDAETERSTVWRVMHELDDGRGGLMVTVNLDHVRRCRRDARYRALVARSELVVADGMPLVWASRVQGTPLPERVAGSNLVWSLCAECALRGRSVFLLGGDPGAAEGARQVLESRFPGLRVGGVLSPERGFEHSPARMAEIEQTLAASKADLVFVALGSPKQEYVAERLRGALPNAWFVGCGITLGFVAGQVRRAPNWMQRIGIEWAHRLAQEPGRLAHRYLVQGIPFAVLLLAGAAWRRAFGPSAPEPPQDPSEQVFAIKERRSVLGRSPARGVANLTEADRAAWMDARRMVQTGAPAMPARGGSEGRQGLVGARKNTRPRRVPPS